MREKEILERRERIEATDTQEKLNALLKAGIITKEEFIAEISNDIGTQIVFKTNRALAQLKYVDKEVLK